MDSRKRNQLEKNLFSILKNGKRWGTGFFVGDGLAVTCSHCLPRLPDPLQGEEDRILVKTRELSGSRTALMEVAFVDPVSDLAVLKDPDGQDFSDWFDEFWDLYEDRPCLNVNSKRLQFLTKRSILLRNVTGKWLSGEATVGGRLGRTLHIKLDNAKNRIQGGTSGSPVFALDGTVLGVCNFASLNRGEGYALALPDYIPMWLMETIRKEKRSR